MRELRDFFFVVGAGIAIAVITICGLVYVTKDVGVTDNALAQVMILSETDPLLKQTFNDLSKDGTFSNNDLHVFYAAVRSLKGLR